MTKKLLTKFMRAALTASVGLPMIFASSASAQLPAPAVPENPAAPAPAAEVERVVVTGSNIPTAEETGPNPVDTYRPQDIEKLGIRNATDLTTFIPQEAGGSVNLNMGNGGDGTVQFNLRGLLPKETLILVDGKRVASAAIFGGVDINLIPFSMIDHIDILKDGASAVYGADAVAGVVNFFLIHKFRGLEIGGTYGNTNLGASNDMGEWEAWLKAGTGDDKTDIVVVADFFQRTGGLFSRDRDISSNGNFRRFGGFDIRSSNMPGRVQGERLVPSLFFSANSPPPHSAPNVATSPFYTPPGAVPGIQNSVLGDGDYIAYNFAAVTPALPPADRQVFYGSFTRDLCDKYLTVFADFKVARSFFDASLAAVPFLPDPFKRPGTSVAFAPSGISVPIQNPFNPFTVGDTTLVINGLPVPMTTGVRFRAINDTGVRSAKFTYWDYLFDVGLKGEMGEFGDYFKTWTWETGFRYARNEGQQLSLGDVSQPGLRDALLDTDPATAFNPFAGINGTNTNAARSRVYVNLHNTGTFELPLAYATITGDLFRLPGGPVSFAIGGEYRGERWDRKPDSLNTTFQTIGSVDSEGSRVNRDVWSIYEELRVPFTSPTWNFPGFYSFEVDFAEREEWYSQNTSAVLSTNFPQGHSTYDAQKPKISVRWQPLDPKYIGALTLRGSYTEAFHAPTVIELSPAGQQAFPLVVDPKGLTPDPQVEERISGNPFLHPEVAYEWTYGAVYSPKWLKGLTLSADWWHIDMRDLVVNLGAQFILNNESIFPNLVQRDPVTGAVVLITDPTANLAGAIFEGLDYEAIYILDSSIFGHGDFGRLTATVNGTWLSRAELQTSPDAKRFGIAGEFLPTSFNLTSSLPWHRANFSLFYDGPADTWMQGLDAGVVVHWIGQYEDDNQSIVGSKPQTPRTIPKGGSAFVVRTGQTFGPGDESPFARKVREWITFDLLLNYTFNLPPPAAAEVPGFAKDGGKNVRTQDGKEKNVLPVSTAEYGCSNFKWWLNNATITLGMQNVTDEDPPFVAGAFENGYDESLTTIKGRFWYVGLKKRF
ncbi:MAG: TonB-dependent receptor plug domain-containing protein [Verrucomicrobia bacterium]|nr:TonB-dependent receptor plug domain-containing protein [Verrucomicrobiota bacterium]